MRMYDPGHEARSRPARQRERDYRLRTQLETIREVMLSAAQRDSWLTLREIAAITHYGEASISAQLRHVRKPAFGSYVVEKRRREGDAAEGRPAWAGWEYKLDVRGWRPGAGGLEAGTQGRRLKAARRRGRVQGATEDNFAACHGGRGISPEGFLVCRGKLQGYPL